MYAQVNNIYTSRRKLSASSIDWRHFPVEHSMHDCRSYDHFNFSHANFHWTKMWRRSACTAPICKIQIPVWILFNGTNCGIIPVITWRHSGEWAVSFSKVNLPESLQWIVYRLSVVVQSRSRVWISGLSDWEYVTNQMVAILLTWAATWLWASPTASSIMTCLCTDTVCWKSVIQPPSGSAAAGTSYHQTNNSNKCSCGEASKP